MPSSVSSESSSSFIAFSMPSSEFEEGEGEQEGNLELEEEVRLLKELVSAKDLELQEVKRQLDDVKNGQTGLFTRMDGSKYLVLNLLLVIIGLFLFSFCNPTPKSGPIDCVDLLLDGLKDINGTLLKAYSMVKTRKNETDQELAELNKWVGMVSNKLNQLEEEKKKLEKEIGALKDQLDTKNEKLEKEMGALKDQLNKIIKNHQQIDQIVIGYARTLPAPDSNGNIKLENGHKYTPEMDIFLRHGAAHCRGLDIWHGTSVGFVGYPANFFDDLIKFYYETKVPTGAVHYVAIGLSLENPAPWPAALVQPQAGEMNVEEVEVKNEWKCVHYIMRNKHNPGIAFKLRIYFEGDAKCYQEMTSFIIWRAGCPIW